MTQAKFACQLYMEPTFYIFLLRILQTYRLHLLQKMSSLPMLYERFIKRTQQYRVTTIKLKKCMKKCILQYTMTPKNPPTQFCLLKMAICEIISKSFFEYLSPQHIVISDLSAFFRLSFEFSPAAIIAKCCFSNLFYPYIS